MYKTVGRHLIKQKVRGHLKKCFLIIAGVYRTGIFLPLGKIGKYALTPKKKILYR
jgi:hypothetical protein